MNKVESLLNEQIINQCTGYRKTDLMIIKTIPMSILNLDSKQMCTA